MFRLTAGLRHDVKPAKRKELCNVKYPRFGTVSDDIYEGNISSYTLNKIVRNIGFQVTLSVYGAMVLLLESTGYCKITPAHDASFYRCGSTVIQ